MVGGKQNFSTRVSHKVKQKTWEAQPVQGNSSACECIGWLQEAARLQQSKAAAEKEEAISTMRYNLGHVLRAILCWGTQRS